MSSEIIRLITLLISDYTILYIICILYKNWINILQKQLDIRLNDMILYCCGEGFVHNYVMIIADSSL